MASLLKLLTISALILSTNGCAFAPRTATEQPYATNCALSSKMMTLDKPRATKAFGCKKTMNGAEFLSCLMVAGVIIPAGSFIISGSIVLINNSMHWLEYQGTCEKKQHQQQTTAVD